MDSDDAPDGRDHTNGHAPETKPYKLDSPQPTANAAMYPSPRCSSAYIVIMTVNARTPNPVTTTSVQQRVRDVPIPDDDSIWP